MFRKAMSLLLPAALALAVLGSTVLASAKSPAKGTVTKETFIDEGIFTLPDIDCGTFWLTEQMVSERVEVSTYVDGAGTTTKTVTKANFLGTVTNSSSGHTFRDKASFTETVDYLAGTTTVTGISYLFVIKGQGVVYAEVGYKVLDTATGEVLVQHGQNDYETYGLEGLCNVLL